MDKKIAGLVGAISALAPVNAVEAVQAREVTEVLNARSYAELLQPIPNAVALLMAADAVNVARAKAEAEQNPNVKLAQYGYHHHHHHHRWYHHGDYCQIHKRSDDPFYPRRLVLARRKFSRRTMNTPVSGVEYSIRRRSPLGARR